MKANEAIRRLDLLIERASAGTDRVVTLRREAVDGCPMRRGVGMNWDRAVQHYAGVILDNADPRAVAAAKGGAALEDALLNGAPDWGAYERRFNRESDMESLHVMLDDAPFHPEVSAERYMEDWRAGRLDGPVRADESPRSMRVRYLYKAAWWILRVSGEPCSLESATDGSQWPAGGPGRVTEPR